MRRRETTRPQGEDKNQQPAEGGMSEERRAAARQELSFQLFQIALARRRIETIMGEQDLAMVVHWRELTFVHGVLSNVHRLLARIDSGTA